MVDKATHSLDFAIKVPFFLNRHQKIKLYPSSINVAVIVHYKMLNTTICHLVEDV